MSEPTVQRDGVTTDDLSIHVLLGRVMSSVGAVAKSDRNQAQNFNFRGIDAVVNAVGPELRKHGVIMVPEAGTPIVDSYASRNGAQMTHVLLPVTFHFYGPAGDSVSCSVIGEAADAGDKVMSKAHSVAWRIAMLQCFAIPTDDPDPDAASHERAPAADPEAWFKDNGWESRAAHDAEREGNLAVIEKWDAEQKDQLRSWMGERGFKLPLSVEDMSEYSNMVDEIDTDPHADALAPGDDS